MSNVTKRLSDVLKPLIESSQGLIEIAEMLDGVSADELARAASRDDVTVRRALKGFNIALENIDEMRLIVETLRNKLLDAAKPAGNG